MKKVLVVLLNRDSIFFVMNNSSDSSKKLNIGDILDSHWGYEQTNVDYYEVVGLTPKGVKIRQIESQRSYTGSMCGECVPVKGMYRGDVKTKQVKATSNGDAYLKLTSFSSAWKWDGKPNFFSEWH